MIISIIAAVGKNDVIGNNNKLPWNLPADLEHFKELTSGKSIIMGQKTFESIGKPLPQRKNIVLSKDSNFKPSGAVVVGSVEEALEEAKNTDASGTMVIGGASVYREFLPLADRMYLTRIDEKFDGDTFFPKYDKKEWKETERIDKKPDKNNPYPYSFVILEKNKN